MSDLLPGLEAAPNIHPMFIHFPIALWLAALGFCAIGALRDHGVAFDAGRWLLYLGTASAAVAAVTGFLAADSLGHDAPGHELVHTHRNYMLAATGLAVAVSAAAFALRRASSARARWGLVLALVVTNGVAALGADRGVAVVWSGIAAPADTNTDTGDGHSH